MDRPKPISKTPDLPSVLIEPGIYRGAGGIREVLAVEQDRVEFVQLAGNMPTQSRINDPAGRPLHGVTLAVFQAWATEAVVHLAEAFKELTNEIRLVPQTRLLLAQAQQCPDGSFRATAAETRFLSAMYNQCIVEHMESDGRFRLSAFGLVYRALLLESAPASSTDGEYWERAYDRRIDELRKAGHSVVIACSIVFAEIEAGSMDGRMRQHALQRLHKAIRAAETTAVAREAAKPIFESVERRIGELKATFEHITHEERAAAIASINDLVAAELTPAEKAIRAVAARSS